MTNKETEIDFKALTSFQYLPIHYEDLVWSDKVGWWCQLPYQDHPHGCPQYNKSPFCPPQAPNMKLYLKKNYTEFILGLAHFNFGKYLQLRKELHPNRTPRQLACLLYWQDSVKKLFAESVGQYPFRKDFILGCGAEFCGSSAMEACGINVFMTLKRLGIMLEIRPKTKVTFAILLCKGVTMLERIMMNSKQ